MPNGYYGPQERWLEMEAPLRIVDPLLSRFAERHGMELSKNYHNWPSRTLEWGRRMRRRLSLYLADQEEMLFIVDIIAVEDRGHARYWRREELKRDVPGSEILEGLPQLLEEGRRKLAAWGRDDLLYAGDLGPG